MKKILTIVIPTYNMEKLLEKNLQSLVIEDKDLLKQVEVLVVNDGSKDHSSDIAHKFEALYPDTFRVIDKENGNYGSCINRGLKEATGKYIRIMDADDWYDTKKFEKYLRKLEGVDVDKIATIFSDVTPDGKTMRPQPYVPEVVMRMEDVDEVNYIPMHAITYRTQFLRDIHYTQTEGMSYTDQEWILLPMPYVKTLYYIALDVYQYYTGREGQTMDPAVMKKSYPQLCHALLRVMSEYRNSLKEAVNKAYVIESVTSTLDWLYDTVFITAKLQGDNAYVRDLDIVLEQSFPDIYNHLAERYISRLYRYKYVADWRKKGRAIIVPETYVNDYFKSHLYIGILRFPIYAIGVVKRRIVKFFNKAK